MQVLAASCAPPITSSVVLVSEKLQTAIRHRAHNPAPDGQSFAAIAATYFCRWRVNSTWFAP